MDYLADKRIDAPTKAHLRFISTLERAAKARKYSRLITAAIIFIAGGAIFFDAELGQGMRASVSSMISGFDIAEGDLNGAGKYVQSTIAMLDY
ncbi:hypothetical protein MNBD_ALPHA07-387 [hydrothermal vent metagenome]|uniref:Uncharacterized protein n=1 Tax=hydrothermal vent metagenome TaxID=652676 RepID=A0A3B0RS62_9ZZZZ